MTNELWGRKEVADYLQCSMYTATQILRKKNCPAINKGKNQHTKVASSAFIAWYEGGMQ